MKDGTVRCIQQKGAGFDPNNDTPIVPPPGGSLPASAQLDMTGFVVRDQGPWGSCVGFAVRGAMGARAIAEHGAFIDFSMPHIWNIAGYGAAACDPVTGGSDIGTVVQADLGSATNVVGWNTWPYVTSNCPAAMNAVPSNATLTSQGLAFIQQASGIRPQSLADIKNAIAQGWPPAIAVTVLSDPCPNQAACCSWWTNSNIDVPVSSEPSCGSHAILLTSYDDKAGLVGFVNSWGETFGDGGFGTFTYKFIENYSEGGYALQHLIYTATQCAATDYCSSHSLSPGNYCTGTAPGSQEITCGAVTGCAQSQMINSTKCLYGCINGQCASPASGSTGADGGTTGTDGGSTSIDGGTTDGGDDDGGSNDGGTGCVVPSDCPAQATACITNICMVGVCGTSNAVTGTPCTDNMGLVCDGHGACVGCNTTADCPGTDICAMGTCVAPTCFDGVMDGSETDVDCGGPICAPCDNSQACLDATDCVSGVCANSVCAPCALDSDCAGGQFCDLTTNSGTCAATRVDGIACTGSDQCATGFCVDGFCCDSICNGACVACSAAAKGGGTDGTCGNVAAGPDPHGQCTDQGMPSCGTNGRCDGNGACQLYPLLTACAAPQCSNGALASARLCDGMGLCMAPTETSCSPYAGCDGGVCSSSCMADSDCTVGNYCNTSGQCVAGSGSTSSSGSAGTGGSSVSSSGSSTGGAGGASTSSGATGGDTGADGGEDDGGTDDGTGGSDGGMSGCTKTCKDVLLDAETSPPDATGLCGYGSVADWNEFMWCMCSTVYYNYGACAQSCATTLCAGTALEPGSACWECSQDANGCGYDYNECLLD
jgi:hypothetical protein